MLPTLGFPCSSVGCTDDDNIDHRTSAAKKRAVGSPMDVGRMIFNREAEASVVAA
jgi:hypothetical protein